MARSFFQQAIYQSAEIWRNGRVQILEACFKNGVNVTDACIVAGIGRRTYYYWIDKYPEIAQKLELARVDIIVASHSAVRKSIDAGNTNLAWDLLQKKRSADFAPQKIEIDAKVTDETTPKSAVALGAAVGEALKKMNEDANKDGK